jgi:hypothetical protein
MQEWTVGAILVVAAVYATWRIFQTLRHADDPCKGCALADQCHKNCKEKDGMNCHKC